MTGADGFIGSHLTEALVRAGYEPRAFVMYNSLNSWGWLDRSAEDVKGNFEVVAGDIRDNGKFVIGALFRRERDLPGPRLQISSDAAAALNILAGAPAPLNVTALRRAEAGDEAPEATGASTQTAPAAETLPEPSDIAEAALPPATSAAAGITAAPVPAPRPEPAVPARKSGGLAKPYVQIGIFSVEANAERAAKQMRGAGMLPTVKRSEINGKPFWRVVVGPAPSKSELDALLKKIKGEGFSDAYAVSN